MSVALIQTRDWESESKIKRVGDLSHHHLNSECLNGLRNSLGRAQERADPEDRLLQPRDEPEPATQKTSFRLAAVIATSEPRT